MTSRTMTVQAKEISKGMFIQSVEGKLASAFPHGGILIETDEQLSTLTHMCTTATVDLSRSSDLIYQQFCSPENTISLLAISNDGIQDLPTETRPTLSAHPMNGHGHGLKAHSQHTDHAAFNTPIYSQTSDKYGYQGRLVYRVLEESFISITNNEPVDLDLLDREIKDFVSYASTNPDLLYLESHLSEHGNTLIGAGMRSILHICNYGNSFNKNESYIQPIALSLIAYVAALNSLPQHISELALQWNLAENAILANGIMKQLREIESHYALPLNVRKTVHQICERFDGQGPQQLAGSKVSQQAQLLHMAFSFEYLQQQELRCTPLTAIDTIAALRAAADTIFNGQLLDRFVQSLPLFPTGCLVNIKDQIAVVTHQHPLRKLSPRTLAIANLDGVPLDQAEWINSEVRLGGLRQRTDTSTGDYDNMIRDVVEIKKPWYQRIINTDAIKSWLQRIDLVG